MHKVTWCSGDCDNDSHNDGDNDDIGDNADENGDDHLLSRVSWEVEDEDGEERDANTGDDQIHLENYYQVTWMKMPVMSVMSVLFTV